MDDTGRIREIKIGESLRNGEISVPIGTASALNALCERARKEYYKARRQGCSDDASLACAQGEHRRRIVRQ